MSSAAAMTSARRAEPPSGGRWLAEWGDLVLPILLLGMLIPVRGIEFLVPSLTLPVNTLACVALAAVAVWSPARWKPASTLAILSAVGLVGWLVIRTVLEFGVDELRRTVNILTLLATAGFIASGRLHVRSLSRGIALGLVLALALSIALMPRSSYAGRLTGVLGDPNAAGYVLVSLGFAAAQTMATRRMRLLLMGIVAGGILLTVSRTSLFAFAVAMLWVWFAPRLGRLWSALLLGGAAWVYLWINTLAEASNWFTARDGSDSLREALAIAERQMSAAAGWYGEGLGSAITEIRGTTLYFHNSYRAMQVEGGLIALGLLFLLLAGIFLMFHRLPSTERPVWAEAAIIAALICSFNIGFSLTSPPFAVAIGLYLAYHGAAAKRLGRHAVSGALLPQGADRP